MADEAGGDKKGKKDKKDKGEKKPKGNLVPAIIIAVGLIGFGKMSAGGGAPAATGTAAPVVEVQSGEGDTLDCAKEDIKKPPVEGAVVDIDPVTINLQDDHYLKVGIALVLSADLDKKLFTEEGEEKKALDPLFTILGGRNQLEFESPRAVTATKKELVEAIRPLYECEVVDVKLTQFVIQ